MPSDIVLKCSSMLAKEKLTIFFAESATAGRLASEFALTPDSGKVLKGSIVCYDACVKEDILNANPAIIKKYTPESAEVTQELCKKLKKLIKSDIYAAVTGLTTPGGSEDPQKPVGTMFLHILYGDRNIGIREVFKGSPEEIILKSIDRISQTITTMVLEERKAKRS